MLKNFSYYSLLIIFSVSLFAQDPPTYLSAVEGDEEVTLYWEMPGVQISEGETCASPIQGGTITDGFTETFNGSTATFENDYVNGFSANGPDVVYEFFVDGNLDVNFSLCGNTWDTYLILFGSNCETQVAFDDDGCEEGLQSEISGTGLSGTYFLIVDGWGTTSFGEYNLIVSATASNRTSDAFRPGITDLNKLNNQTELENINKYEVYGTTESHQEPAPSIVHPDYSRNSRSVPVMIECDGGSWQTEVTWEIFDESGTIVASGGAPYLETASLDHGVYSVNGYDSWGDGWNGNSLIVTNASNEEEYLNWTIETGETGTTTFEVDTTVVAGDLIGYNAYVDGTQHNSSIIQLRNYSVDGLTNNVTYELGVSAVYFVNENETDESEIITVSASPTFLYGDITGVITDPNGSTLDSVVVSSGDFSDTTDQNGTYTLWNLNTGSQTVTLSRFGFSTVSIDTLVLAQAEPTILDVMLSPDMPKPAGLEGTPLDQQVYLEWRTPGDGEELTIQYDDGVLSTAFYFFDTYEDGFAHGMRFDVGGGFDVLGASIKILSEGDEFWPWPDATHGPVRILIFDDNNGYPGNLLHDEESIAEDGWATIYPDLSGLDGAVYVLVSHSTGWTDLEGFGVDASVDYAENMITLYDGEWNYGDYLGYGGDYMMAVHVMYYGGGVRTLSSVDNTPPIDYNSTNINASLMASTSNLTPINFSSEPTHPVFISPINIFDNRDNELLEYRVYEIDSNGDETFLVATVDTFATVDASPNYLEYCYNVRAFWDTGDPSDGGYGQLESRASNTICAVPFTYGDADFDSDVDISDVLSAIDFILEQEIPSEDQTRNCDLNNDEEINIADIIMMIDIIFGGMGRTLGFDPSELAYIDLKTDFNNSKLGFDIEYSSPVRGIEFELEYDPDLVKVLSPSLSVLQENVMVSFTEKEDGKIKVIAANLRGGSINGKNNSYLSIPVEFIGDKQDVTHISLGGNKIAGVDGQLIETVARTISSEVKVIPDEFVLHQNFPNPFNPSTEIRFDLPEASVVNLTIFNIMGQKIRTLSNTELTPGYHTLVWDGTSDNGSQVATGMYFFAIQTDKYQSTKKMLFLK